MVRSAIQRLGRTTNLPASDRLTISRLTCRETRRTPCWNPLVGAEEHPLRERRTCATFTVTIVPFSNTISWLQSN